MAVFTEEEGLGIFFVVDVLARFLYRGIHTALDVYPRAFGVLCLIRRAPCVQPAGYVLAVNKAARHTAMQVICHNALIVAHSRLVAERPHDDRGMVFVALEHTRNAVEQRFGPLRLTHKVIPVMNARHSVRLKICFVAEVNAHAVTHSGKTRIVRIVARADHVDIVTFEDIKIAQHMVVRSGRTEQRVAVVAVHALCLDLFAVYVYHLVLYADILEADGNANMLTAAGDAERVERGGLIRPERRL